MTTEQGWLVAASAVALVALFAAALSWRYARRARTQLSELTARLAELESRVAPASSRGAGDASYVITAVETGPETDPAAPSPETSPAAQRIDGRLFTDIVAREAVVTAASWSQGVRRALSPESRNRIRFQVRQQAKQGRRDRRAEVREALRHYRARHRADEGDAA